MEKSEYIKLQVYIKKYKTDLKIRIKYIGETCSAKKGRYDNHKYRAKIGEDSLETKEGERDRQKVQTHTYIHTQGKTRQNKLHRNYYTLVAVRQRVKYEQKSRHRYRVYANSLSGIDERQDVTANIRSPHLSYCRIRTHTHTYVYMYSLHSVHCLHSHDSPSARFVRDLYSFHFSNTPNTSRSDIDFLRSLFIIDPLSFPRSFLSFAPFPRYGIRFSHLSLSFVPEFNIIKLDLESTSVCISFQRYGNKSVVTGEKFGISGNEITFLSVTIRANFERRFDTTTRR